MNIQVSGRLGNHTKVNWIDEAARVNTNYAKHRIQSLLKTTFGCQVFDFSENNGWDDETYLGITQNSACPITQAWIFADKPN